MTIKKPTYEELEQQIVALKKLQKETSLDFKNVDLVFESMSEKFKLIELIFDDNKAVTDYRFLKINSAFEKLAGKSRKDLVGRSSKEILNLVEGNWLDIYEKVNETGKTSRFEQYCVAFDSIFEVFAWKVAENEIAVVFDHVKQDRLSDAQLIAEKESQYKMLFDSMSEMVQTIELIYDSKGKPIDYYIRDINSSFVKFLGKPKKQIINKKATSLVKTIEYYWLEAFASADKTGVRTTIENYSKEYDKYYYITAWKIASNKLGVSVIDITDQKKQIQSISNTKLKLEKSERELNEAQSLAHVGSWLFNPATKAVEFSEEMFQIWEFNATTGTPKYKSIINRIHKEDVALYSSSLAKAIKTALPYDIQFRICPPNEKEKVIRAICKPLIDANGNVFSLSGTNQDITAQELFKVDQIKHLRLKAIGEMSSSIAHDFNNSLQGIVGNLEIIKNKNTFSDTGLKRLQNIESIISDVADRVSGLQKFGDPNYDDKTAVIIDFNKLITESLKQSKPLWKDAIEKEGYKIAIKTDFQEIPKIVCNRGELKSTIYNIIKNSIDAMPNGGVLQVKTGTKENNVHATFTDNGIGMSKESVLRIFQPFYTTKGLQPGRGLGMSGAYSTIKKQKGNIVVLFSEPNKGTSIEITLPASNKLIPKKNKKSILEHKNKYNILWVDDDFIITEFAKILVQSLGHNCVTVNSGKKALQYLANNPCDIVFTDIGMPEMNGWQLADSIKSTYNSKIKIIAVTGWDIEQELKAESAINVLLKKPFSAAQLKKALQVI